MAPAKYIVDSRKKTKAWTNATKIPMAMIGSGAKNAPASMNKMVSTNSWPVMLPKSRKERDSTLARWPMTSIGKMIGISHHTGPRKCLIYLIPWYLTPIKCVNRNTGMAQDTVVLILAVGG